MPLPANRRALSVVLIAVVIDTVGFGIIIPVIPALIRDLTGEGLGAAAEYNGWLLFTFAAMQFIFAPVLGNLSDRFGRRPILLTALAVLGLDCLVMGFAPTIAWLFIARAIAGACGGLFAAANAYVSDISDESTRAANFGLVSAAWGIGFVVGPVIGGLLGELGARVPFFFAAGLCFTNALVGFFVLPETLPEHRRRPFSLRRANPVGMLKSMARYPLVIALFSVLVLHNIAHDANPAVWSFYVMEKFAWSAGMIGVSLGVVGVSIALVQGLVIRRAIPLLGEYRAVVFGFLVMSAGFMGFALAPNGTYMLAFILPFALGGIAMPALRSMLASQVPKNEQGELQGAISSLYSFTALLGPLMLTQLFGWSTSEAAPIYFPGAPFALASVLVALAALVFMLVVARYGLTAAPRRRNASADPVVPESEPPPS